MCFKTLIFYMTTQEINKTYNRIIGFLDNKELKNAFDHLQGLIAGSYNYEFQDKLDGLQNTYKYMLRYKLEGFADPMQHKIYTDLLRNCYELTDKVRIKALSKESSRLFFNTLRTNKFSPDKSFVEIQSYIKSSNPEEKEKYVNSLFKKIWTNSSLSIEEAAGLKDIIEDPEIENWIKCQIASSLWLSIQEVFDSEKVMILFKLYLSDEIEIKARALVSILLSLYFYRKRIWLYNDIQEKVINLHKEKGQAFLDEAQIIILKFILSRETEKICHKLQNEIIPEMMKLNPKISEKINLKDITPEQLGDEMNPEWQEKIFADKELSKMMTEFSDLQLEGADVMHSTFVHLKNYPFFREISNWFVPFRKDNPYFGKQEKNSAQNSMVEALVRVSPYMCNSDKYSLYLSMLEIPEQFRQSMSAQIDSQAVEMLEQKNNEIKTSKDSFKLVVGQYIQDLYRFYKLHPAHLDFDDIFTYPLDFHNLPIIDKFFFEGGDPTPIAEYYLQKNYFSEALKIYNRLVEKDASNDTLFQKIGYCKQMLEDLDGALEAYLQADLLNMNSKWVIRRIANCYRLKKEPQKALEYYHRYEEKDPDNLSVQISIGHCHLELKNYSEALKYYYKVDYLDTKSHKAWRPIAWCSFLTGKYDMARNYYKKILEETTPNIHDYLNAGHTELILQNMKGALLFYKKAISLADYKFDKFKEEFEQDIPELEKAGFEKEEIPVFMDLLKYYSNEEII